MRLVCLQKSGVDLYRTLSESETSRNILRFYHPREEPFGISLDVSTVSSALSLTGELRWYIMRYIREVLIEDEEHGVFLTQALAREVYDLRSVNLVDGWDVQFRVCVTEDGGILRVPEGVPEPDRLLTSFNVWGLAGEHP